MTYQTTEDGPVYAPPTRLGDFVSTDPNTFSDQVSTTGDPSTWQLKLEGLQADAKAVIDDWCHRDFEDHPGETVVIDGVGQQSLELPEPVRSVSSVEITDDSGTTALDAYTPGTAGEAYLLQDGRLLRFEDGQRTAWPDGYETITVTLDWGYADAPRTIQRAELMLVDHTLVGMAQKREEMVVQAGDGPSATVNIPVSMNGEVAQMLRAHRETGPVGEVI